jgi:NAD(P)-dependent dehydrogenase (short-subunit alcohol dehydrogenase family)
VRCPCCGDQGRVRSGCRGIACNVSDWVQCGHLVEASYDHFGKVDILVNDAGLSPLYPSVDAIDEALFDKVIGVNLKGPFRLTAAIGTRMVTDGGGSIINVTSIEAIRPSANAVPYSAAKAGLNAMTEAMAKALAPTVRVNAIQAGPFLTDVSKALEHDRISQDRRPLHRFAPRRRSSRDSARRSVFRVRGVQLLHRIHPAP